MASQLIIYEELERVLTEAVSQRLPGFRSCALVEVEEMRGVLKGLELALVLAKELVEQQERA